MAQPLNIKPGTLQGLDQWKNDTTKLNQDNLNAMGRHILKNTDYIKQVIGRDSLPSLSELAESGLTLTDLSALIKASADSTNTEVESIKSQLSHLEDTDVIVSTPEFTFSPSGDINEEVGSNIIVSYDIQFDSGEYKYGPTPTGCVESDYVVTFNEEVISGVSSGSFSEAVHIEDNTLKYLTAQCTYTSGNTPLTNLGRRYAEGAIVGETVEIKKKVKGYRQAFAGGTSTKTFELQSDNIRSLTGKGANRKSFDVKIQSNDVKVIIAFPDAWGSLTSVLDINDSSKNIVSSFNSLNIIPVSGRTSGKDFMDYKVYVMDFASEYGNSGNTYKVTIS